MAYVSASSSNNWILPLKVVLISTGVVSMAVVLKLLVPVVSDFVACEVPSIWSFVLSCLRPPYLYLVINCIIISIVASSKLHQKPDDPQTEMQAALQPAKVPEDVREESVVYGDSIVLTGYGYDAANVSVSELQVVDSEGVWGQVEKKVTDEMLIDGGDDAVLSRSTWTEGLERKDSLEVLYSNNENEKPPVSARFAHRRPLKASPEAGKALGVSKPKRQETLENTWKTITEGRSMPLTRHLKKSDTWDSQVRRNQQPMDENTPPKMKKTETFSDRSANSSLTPSPGSGRLRKEPSLGQDELNRRVEAFIKKFNEEMRLQRQESLNQYHEMIHRGAH
ncbi:hypothetical protein CJ030_MR4G021121 [Morella rubra]|uniref:DUF4408 domain-containing protein n=1 Tax=Morella rubra TaxID=262757 RepID=A0A6A1W311_9ROSI|nr:hypothetical protein CJ030_MR4G021121 [Morella rubra]